MAFPSLRLPGPALPAPLALVIAASVGAGLALSPAAAQAGPVLCTTTLEAPPAAGLAPVQVSRCGPVITPAELIERRAFTWRAAYAAGVDPLRQLTDLLGIATGGPDGQRLMGLGFPEQTLIWDGSAVQATAGRLLETQSEPLPWRSGDVPSGFSGSLW